MPTPPTYVPTKTRIFVSRFVEEIRRAGSGSVMNIRLIEQNYAGEWATLIATKARTLYRFSQQLMLSLAVSLPNMKAFMRDIIQAYIQSDSQL